MELLLDSGDDIIVRCNPRICLFQLGDFISHSGRLLRYKIECDALTDPDWECLAFMAMERLSPFSQVIGVPTGGMKLAQQLSKYVTPGEPTVLIADDVLTSGGSMEEFRAKAYAEYPEHVVAGVVAFARGEYPGWIEAIWRRG